MPAPAGRIISNQVRGWRRIKTATLLADNVQDTVDLPRGPAIEEAIVTIDGTFNVTTLYTAVRLLAPWQFFRRVDWRINGSVTLDSISGIGSYMSTVWTQRYQDFNTPPVSAAVGLKTIRASCRLSRVLTDMVRPKDSVLKTDEKVTSNQLVIQFGALSDMFTGAGVSAYTGALTYSVWIRDYQEAADANGRTPIPTFYVKRTEQLINVAATGNNIAVRLNTGNRLRGFIFRLENGGEGADNILNGLRLVRSGDTRLDLDDVMLAEQARIASLGLGEIVGSVVNSSGIRVVDLGNPGMYGSRYSEWWPVPSNADVQALFDIGVAPIAIRIVQLEGVDMQSGNVAGQ